MNLPPDDCRCTGTNYKGERCRNYRASGHDACFFHIKQPFKAEIRREPRRPTDGLDTATGIHNFLARTLDALASGQISPGRATSLCYVAQTMLTSLARAREEQIALHPEITPEGTVESVIVKATLDSLFSLHQQANASGDNAIEIIPPLGSPPEDPAP